MQNHPTIGVSPDSTSTLPTVDYESLIQARAAEVTAAINFDNLAPEFRTPEHKVRLRAQHIASQREIFRAWEVLGNHFADILENPDTPSDVHNVIVDELLELADRAGLSMTSPEILRLMYPLLRDRLFEKEVGRG
jgi:hypothetical protein